MSSLNLAKLCLVIFQFFKKDPCMSFFESGKTLFFEIPKLNLKYQS